MNLINFLQEYIYFTGVLLYSIPFLIILVYRKIDKKEFFASSFLFGICGVILSNFAIVDYWHPKYIFQNIRFEDFFYGAFYGGAVVYLPHIFIKQLSHHAMRFYFLMLSGIITCLMMVVLIYILKINSIMAHIIPLIIIGSLSIIIHKKNLKYQLYSGILSVTITFIIFQILLLVQPAMFIETWELDNTSNIFIAKILLEEYIFAFSLGFGGSMFYDTVAGKDPI